MKGKRKNRKKEQKPVADPRDKKVERIVFAFIILLILVAIVVGYLMSKEFAEN